MIRLLKLLITGRFHECEWKEKKRVSNTYENGNVDTVEFHCKKCGSAKTKTFDFTKTV